MKQHKGLPEESNASTSFFFKVFVWGVGSKKQNVTCYLKVWHRYQKGRLVQGPDKSYKPICRDCAIFNYSLVSLNKAENKNPDFWGVRGR